MYLRIRRLKVLESRIVIETAVVVVVVHARPGFQKAGRSKAPVFEVVDIDRLAHGKRKKIAHIPVENGPASGGRPNDVTFCCQRKLGRSVCAFLDRMVMYLENGTCAG